MNIEHPESTCGYLVVEDIRGAQSAAHRAWPVRSGLTLSGRRLHGEVGAGVSVEYRFHFSSGLGSVQAVAVVPRRCPVLLAGNERA